MRSWFARPVLREKEAPHSEAPQPALAAEAAPAPVHTPHPVQKAGLGLLIGALGVVFGDIGTSPLYAMTEAFFGHYPLARNPENILGVVSLVFWSLIVVVTIKYVLLILRADNDGEGGLLAMLGLLIKKDRNMARRGSSETSESFSQFMAGFLKRGGANPFHGRAPLWLKGTLVTFILLGVSLLYGDGIITPAISVLSAVEGLRILTPAAQNYLVPLTLIILAVLFVMQHKGTHAIGVVFGPIMLLWFSSLAIFGAIQVFDNPQVLAGLNPLYALHMAQLHGSKVFLILGAVVLCVTGVEAMYADLGHFGRRAITRAWTFLVMPCLVLNYLGQGAFMLSGAAVPENHLFYAIVPSALLIPMVALATMATVIASQALISGAFSLTSQAIAMGLFPRLKIVHTNPKMPGQVYLPFINWTLFLGCAWLVLAFKNSTSLAAAYGIAVTGTMAVTTTAFAVVAIYVFGQSKRLILPLMGLLLCVDLLFFSSNLLKFGDGGYVPVLVGLMVFLVMDTWRWGRTWLGRVYQERLKEYTLTVADLIANKATYLDMTPSTSLVVMASRPIELESDRVPPVMAVHFKNWRHLPKHIIFFSVIQTGSAYVSQEERYSVHTFLRDNYGTIVSARATYGYMEQPDVRAALLEMKKHHLLKIPYEPSRWLILVGAERFVTPGRNRFEQLRIELFARMNRQAKPVTDYFGLAADSGVTLENINV